MRFTIDSYVATNSDKIIYCVVKYQGIGELVYTVCFDWMVGMIYEAYMEQSQATPMVHPAYVCLTS